MAVNEPRKAAKLDHGATELGAIDIGRSSLEDLVKIEKCL